MTQNIKSLKTALRARAVEIRAGVGEDAAVALRERLLGMIDLPPGAVIAGIWPLPGEIDLRPLLELLHTRGLFVALPETTPRGQPLIFRRWKPDSTMVAEKFGTFRPDGPELTPDLFLVPLLAFDRAGGRLGYGGGYYDRTLPLHPGKPAWGFAYAAQEVDKLPMEPHDHRLDAIVTEAGVIFPDGR